MKRRALPSGIVLTKGDAKIVKGMLLRGDRQHDIAAWFGVNGGRIGEIASGQTFRNLEPAPQQFLPPPGPYPSGRDTAILMLAINKARQALDDAKAFIRAGITG